jgi:Predicted integral membrane protein (DUF2269)
MALAAHLTFSVGWVGSAAAYLALAIVVRNGDPQTMQAGWIAMDITGWYVIVPLAVASLLTGVVMAVGTKWGLFRHYWVVFSLVLTSMATLVLILHMPDVSVLADVAREAERGATGPENQHLVARLSRSDLLHPAVGLIVLLVIQVMNVYKPRGLTRYGWRKQRGERVVEDEPQLS